MSVEGFRNKVCYFRDGCKDVYGTMILTALTASTVIHEREQHIGPMDLWLRSVEQHFQKSAGMYWDLVDTYSIFLQMYWYREFSEYFHHL